MRGQQTDGTDFDLARLGNWGATDTVEVTRERLRTRAPDWTAAQTFDADQTFRHAEAAGDPMPIHLDDDFAKAMGLPGIIVHGLCTIAFVSHALLTRVGPDTPARLKRPAVRLSSTTRPGQTSTTSAWPAGRGRYVFETRSDRGKFVIQDGLAEFAHAQEETT